MRLLRFCAIFVTLLGVAAMAIVVMPALSSRARAQGRIYAERPYDAGQSQRDDRPERRGRALTLLGGRGSGLGVRITDRTEGGVVIDEVVEDSPAEKAGLKRSDVIVEFDGERVRSARQFSRLVQETPSGRTVKLTITRDGKRQDLQVTPDERRGDAMVSGDFGDYMRDLGRDLGQFGDRLAPFNFNFDFGMPMLSGRRLGVTVDPLTSQLAEYFGVKDGLLVTSVAEGSAAARAGLKAGDVITSVDGERVASREDLMRGLRDASNEDVKIGIMRDKKESSVTAKIEAPARRTPRGRPA